MSRVKLIAPLLAISFLMLSAGGVCPAAAAGLVKDGDFEACRSGKSLRRDSKGQDWYESRRDGKGHSLLKLSTKSIGGNKTRKGMIEGNPDVNTYLSQRFTKPQFGRFLVRYDIYVREIFPDDNRSAFFFLGQIWDKKGGPNSTASERFAFLGFENADEEGKMKLFARESDSKWSERTIVVPDLDLRKWYTIAVDVDVEASIYRVKVEGVSDWFELESVYYKDETPAELTHLSFASWNDGAGTFYVDNVSAVEK
jgi:hypothetical protein